jgi:hypothetical protein
VLVQVLDLLSAFRLKFGNTADHLDMVAAVALPHGNGISPEPVAADGPIACPLEPLAETAVLEVVGHPGNLFVGTEHVLFDLVDVDEPTAHGPIDQRFLGSIAERIRVEIVLALDQKIVLFEVGNDILVGILDKTSFKIGHLIGEAALQVYRTDNGIPLP